MSTNKPRSARASAQTPKKIVVVGCGDTTRTTHAPNLACNPGVGRIGWVDPNREARDGMAALYRGVAYRDLATALGREEPDGVVIATALRSRCEAAMAAIKAGADVLLETGGKTVGEMQRILAAAKLRGVTVQMPFPEPLAIAAARRAAPFAARTAKYTWFRHDDPGPDGVFEVVVHGIATVLEGFRWVLPSSGRATWVADEHYRVELFYGSGDDPAATIEVARNHKMPEGKEEQVGVTFETDADTLRIPLRTTKTPLGGDYMRLWVASLGSDPLLPVHGPKALLIQIVSELVGRSLEAGGERVGLLGLPEED